MFDPNDPHRESKEAQVKVAVLLLLAVPVILTVIHTLDRASP